jgi:excinuclease UvrABC nuclease subunit
MPTVSTVYRFYNANQRCIYVGITTAGLTRLHSHRNTRDFWPEIASIALEHFEDDREARRRERFLIEELHPEYNKRFRVLPLPPEIPSAPSAA